MERVINGRRYVFDLGDSGEVLAGLTACQVEAFLVPHEERIVAYIEATSETSLPDPTKVRLKAAVADRRPAGILHTTIGPGEIVGPQILEIVFVQALLSSRPVVVDVRTAHRIVCGAIAHIVDETFICALEFVREPC